MNLLKNEYKINFIMNALDRGWHVEKKNDDEYIFSKKHFDKKKYFRKDYLGKFIRKCSLYHTKKKCDVT